LITSCATAAAIILFVALGSQVLPAAFTALPLEADDRSLTVAFLLNIAIILFGWRRSKDLKEALEAYDAAARLADRNANTDPTTGLANRRELVRALDEGLAAKRGVFLVLDLDHFKRVNDLYGHLAGDKVLRLVANAAREAAPADACCARTGGDEFAGMYTDSHAGPCPEPVWELLDYAISRTPNLRGVTFEFHFSYYTLMGESGVRTQLDRARAAWARR